MRKRNAILLLGPASYEEYEGKTAMENVHRIEDRLAEGLFDRWEVVSWTTSLERAEQEGAAMELQEQFRDVVVLRVDAERCIDTN